MTPIAHTMTGLEGRSVTTDAASQTHSDHRTHPTNAKSRAVVGAAPGGRPGASDARYERYECASSGKAPLSTSVLNAFAASAIVPRRSA